MDTSWNGKNFRQIFADIIYDAWLAAQVRTEGGTLQTPDAERERGQANFLAGELKASRMREAVLEKQLAELRPYKDACEAVDCNLIERAMKTMFDRVPHPMSNEIQTIRDLAAERFIDGAAGE